MQDESTLIHCEHVSARSFHQVVAVFEAAIGAGDGETFRETVEASTGPDDFETRMRAADLPSSLMARFKNQRATAAAKILDRKLSAPAETATGASA